MRRAGPTLLLLLLSLPSWAQIRDPEPVPDEREKPWAFGIEVRMPVLKGEPARFNSDVGVGIGAHILRGITDWFAVRVSVDHDRTWVRRPVPLPDLGIQVTRYQNLTSTSFLGEGVFRWSHRWLTLHFAVGLGVYISFYSNAEAEEARKIDSRAVLPGLKLEAGASFKLHRSFSLGLAFNYNFRRDQVTVPDPTQLGGPQLRPFDDFMALGLRFDYLF
jgi:hypothetical protein